MITVNAEVVYSANNFTLYDIIIWFKSINQPNRTAVTLQLMFSSQSITEPEVDNYQTAYRRH